MDEKPTLEKVLHTIDVFYKNADPQANREEMAEAHTWLMKLQTSVHAWEIADQLLRLKRDIPTSTFAAHTMRAKIQFSFAELPVATHQALRESLLSNLTSLCEAPRTVTTQLSLALADLALQSNWLSAVMDTIQTFHDSLPKVLVMLDVLKYLPEELYSRALRLGPNRRSEWKEVFRRDCVNVLSILTMCLDGCGSDVDVQTRVLSCLASWLSMKNFPVDQVAQSTLISLPFQVLNRLDVPEALYSAATESICSALFLVDSSGGEYRTLSRVLMAEVKALVPVYQASVEAGDPTRSNCLCRVFTELGESFLLECIHSPHSELGDLSVFDILLQCTANPDREAADKTFNFWYRLSEELYKVGGDRSGQDRSGPLCKLFQPYVEKLIATLCQQCEFEDDGDRGRLPNDATIFHFREGVLELVRDVVFIVGSLETFHSMYQRLCVEGLPWPTTEACIFVMCAVAPSLRPDESEVVPVVMETLLSIPEDTHVAIKSSILDLIAELARWLNKHSQFLDKVLAFILSGLRNREISTHAAWAIQAICEHCRESMVQNLDGLLQIVEAGDSLGITPEAVTGLYKSAARVVCLMDHQQITAGISTLCQKIATPLQAFALPGEHEGDPSIWMDRLAAVFRNSVVAVVEGEVHPCMSVVVQMWDTITAVIANYQDNVRVIERACRCLRYIIRCVRTSGRDLLPHLLQLTLNIYERYKHSCFLYLTSVVIDEFGQLNDLQSWLMSVVEAVAQMAFPVVAGRTGFDEDAVDDLFRLCGRCLQRCPTHFLRSPLVHLATRYGLAATTLHHRDANASLMMFFRELMACVKVEDGDTDERRSIVGEVMRTHGAELANSLVTDLACLPMDMNEEITVVLYEMLQYSVQDAQAWLMSAVRGVSSSSLTRQVHVTDGQKEAFVRKMTGCSSLDDMKAVTKDFAHLFR